jgi:hypothetical protein
MSWVLYALPCVAIWSLYLLSYFPGIMSPDSLEQWKQLLAFKFVDVHPAFHTLTNWAITRVWFSPAAIALTQILALAIVFALTMRELERMNVPRWVRIAITLVFSLSPVNGFMSIVLWKDVAFTISMLALWMLFLHIVSTHESALASGRFLATLALVLLAVSLYRINGLPVVLLVLGMLGWLYAEHRKRILLTGAGWAAGFLLVRVGLYGLLQVAPAPQAFIFMLPINQVVALHQNTAMSPDETRFLNTLAQPQFWDFYRCSVPNPAIYLATGPTVGQFDQTYLASHTMDFLRVWYDLASRNPGGLVENQFCLSSMLWRIFPLPGSYLYTVQPGIDRNDLGLATLSLWPQMESILGGVYNGSMTASSSWWVWRPALYLFLALAVILLVPFDRRQRVLVLSVPLVHSLVLLPLIAGQDFRYQYPVYVIALIAPGLLFARISFQRWNAGASRLYNSATNRSQ